MSFIQVLHRHAVALLRDLAGELEERSAEHGSPEDEPEPDGPGESCPPWHRECTRAVDAILSLGSSGGQTAESVLAEP